MKRKNRISEESLLRLRRAMLLAERAQTRVQGRRKLERMAQWRHLQISPLAQAGLASSYYWAGDYSQAIGWARQTIHRYPMSAAAVWCSTLMVLVFRSLGMKRERFEAEGERFRIMRRIAFQSASVADRMYALQELQKELESRDLAVDAQRCAEELNDLIGQRSTFGAEAN